ncbi:hypothetical protein B0A49_08720 [Cryomyces minteri]|uniref:Inner kinetochore subunit AME1 domain-containing protein n=1 Tax=Cryomyces minteri TaxID=331657 RepID=A0A4U0WZ37_9PEZI|nr:hypothetical protein B0A49_08720 [Cryomyces minteri]
MRAGADGDEDELDQNGETHHLSGGARRTGSHNFLPITAPVELIDSSNSVGETIGVARRNNEKRKSAQLQQTESSEDELESPPDQALSTSGRRKKRPGSVDPLSSVEKTPVQYTQDSAASLQRSARAQRHAGREEDERAAASEDELSPVTRPPGGIPTIPEQPSRVEQREQTGDAESADELTSVVKRARNKPRRPPTQPEAAQTKATESEAEADELTPVTKRSQPESSRPKTQKASQRPPNVSRKPRAPKPADTPAVASPVPSRKAPPAAETAKRGHPIDAGVRPRKRSKPSTIASVPITVYRPSLPARPRASSPTSSDDADPLSHHSSSAPTRTTVNGIDVLAQISTEIIERMTGTLSLRLRSEASARARADGKRKRVALLAFGAELGAALFTLTGTVDAHAELGRRVRRAGKERVRLRAELLGVRREREEVACRADEVRAAHEREVGEARDWQGLSKNLFDVELAVQRGRDKAEREGRVGEGAVMGVGNLVGGVVGDVVGGGGGRGEGLLGRIRKFNALLERAAEGLEGR